MSSSTFVPSPSLYIVRANKQKNGSASRWELSRPKDNELPKLFLSAAKQEGENENGDATFAWRRYNKDDKTWSNTDKSVSMKLGTSDIGELLAVISGRKNAVGNGKGLFHENPKGNSTLDFKLWGKENEDPSGFLITITNKGIDNKEAVRISHTLSFGDAENLRIFLQRALVDINNWHL